MAVALVFVPPAAAATAFSDGRVFRYRAGPGERVHVDLDFSEFAPGNVPTEFVARSTLPVDTGRGCGLRQSNLETPLVEVVCALNATVDRRALRYRFSLSDGDDEAVGLGPVLLHGVIYGGAGKDEVEAGDRVYGGRGDDSVEGTRAFGGPGYDNLYGVSGDDARNVLRGGRDGDALTGPGWLYGGPGDDFLEDVGASEAPVPDMLVGGPGRDTVELIGGGRTVVRLRGGGIDTVNCPGGSAAPTIVLFVDHSDRVGPNCSGAQILFKERPHRPA